jgi:hypothetical protein
VAAVTLLGSATFSTSSGTKTVTATPAANDLIVIITANTGSTTTSAAPTDDQSGTYTLVPTNGTAVKVTSADTMQVWVRDSLISSATSTIFTQAPGTTTGGGLVVLKVTGMGRTGSLAIKQAAKQDNQASGTPAPVFGSAPQTGNPVIGAVFNGASPAALTPRANFTERADVGYNSPATGLEVMSRDSGETATTQTWGSSSGSAFCSIVVELDTSPITHSSTGAVTGQGSTVAGYSSRGATRSKTSTLTENFNGTYPNGWSTGVDSGATQTFSGGALEQNITNGTGYLTAAITRSYYDLTDSSVYVKLVQPFQGITGLTTGDYWCRFVLVDEANTGSFDIMWRYVQGLVTGDWSGPIGGGQTFSATYSQSTHAWWRIRESGGTVYFDTAPDSASNPPVSGDWVNRGSVSLSTTKWTPHNVQIQIFSQGLDNRDALPTGPAKWDGFNTSSGAGTVTHTATGAITGQGSVVAGTAIRNATHTSTGAITGQGSTVAGSASRTHVHDSSGAIVGSGATVSGAAARSHVHTTTGAIVGQGSTVSGSAARSHIHDSSGAIVGSGAVVAGSAQRTGTAVTHNTTGAIVGPGATVAGTASRTHVHDTTGAISGQGSTVTGSATRAHIHDTSGAIVGQGSVVVGTAARSHLHDSSGAIVGSGAVVEGTASRTGVPVTHVATGAIVGQGAVVIGEAGRPSATSYDRGPAVFGRGALGKGKVLQGMNYYQSKLSGQDAIRNIARGNSMAMAIASAVAAGEY